MRIGLMVWEIGRRGFFEQFEWAAANGFDAVAFHVNRALAPRRGLDPEAMTEETWARLKAAAARFADADIHAPFGNGAESLVNPGHRARRAWLQRLETTLRVAATLGAKTVTVHRGSAPAGLDGKAVRDLLVASLVQLDGLGSALGVRVGLEATEDFDLLERVSFANVGVTVDVGHLSFKDGAAWKPWGSLGGLIRHLGQRVVHVHVHDYDGRRDHLPLGSGKLDFGEITAALKAIGYEGALCLELAPTPTIEKDYLRSRDVLRALLG
ncbi:MAG TPA: sugar phosphate isomerase/epimerase family protein [Planctomycetota bacterium]|nr:sugar phosphate isomerase/epimerase family protein [Planctomycetota bacterium]